MLARLVFLRVSLLVCLAVVSTEAQWGTSDTFGDLSAQICPQDAPVEIQGTSASIMWEIGQYPPDSWCSWRLDLSNVRGTYSSMKISFSWFDTEQNYDYVKIERCIEGMCSELSKHSGSSAADEVFPIPEAGYIQIVFTSDGSTEKSGFIANFEFSNANPTSTFWNSVCPLGKLWDIDAITVDANLYNPEDKNLFCAWVLNVPENSAAVTIYFADFNLKPWDMIQVYSCPHGTDGNLDLYGMSGEGCLSLAWHNGEETAKPADATYPVNGMMIVVTFRAWPGYNEQGTENGQGNDNSFALSYQAASNDAVDPYFQMCVATGVTMEADPASNSGSVNFFPPANGEQCCENKGYDEAQCNTVGCCEWDDQQCWSAVGQGQCSGSQCSGPGTYRSNSICRWILASNPETTTVGVLITFTGFNTEGSYDYVFIELCPLASTTSCTALASYSGETIPSEATYSVPSNNRVVVRFTSDSGYEPLPTAALGGGGFSLDYQFQGDNGQVFTQPEGIVTGPAATVVDKESDQELQAWWDSGGSSYYSQFETWQDWFDSFETTGAGAASSSRALEIDRTGPYRVLVIFAPPFLCTDAFPCRRAWNMSLTDKQNDQSGCISEGSIRSENGVCVHGLMIDIMNVARINETFGGQMQLWYTESAVLGGYDNMVREIMSPGFLTKSTINRLKNCPQAEIESGHCVVYPEGVRADLKVKSKWSFPCGEEPCHAAFGDITANVQRKIQYKARFTQPYYKSQLKLLGQTKDNKVGNWFNFLDPFSWDLWVAFFGMLLFVGLAFAIMEDDQHINEENLASLHQDKGGDVATTGCGRAMTAFRHSAWEAVWQAWLTPFFAMDQQTKRLTSRALLWIWLATMFILTASYTASLTSFLVDTNLKLYLPDIKPDDENAVRALAVSAKKCLRTHGEGCIAVSQGGATERYLLGRVQAEKESLTSSAPFADKSSQENFLALLKSEGEEFDNVFGWVADESQIDFALQNADEKTQCKWVQVGQGFGDTTFAAVIGNRVPKNRLSAINTALELAEKDGSLAQIQEVWFKTPQDCGGGRSETEALTLLDFAFLFISTLVVGVIGMLSKIPNFHRKHYADADNQWDEAQRNSRILASPTGKDDASRGDFVTLMPEPPAPQPMTQPPAPAAPMQVQPQEQPQEQPQVQPDESTLDSANTTAPNNSGDTLKNH